MTPAFVGPWTAGRIAVGLAVCAGSLLCLTGCPSSMDDCAATATCAPPPDAAMGDGSSDGGPDAAVVTDGSSADAG